MNYKLIYDTIIKNRQLNPLSETKYGEIHHIVPVSLGGSDDKSNLIRLSAREHFICHALLAEMYDKYTFEWYKMNHAFMMMKSETSNQNRYLNNRLYESKKKDFSDVMSYSQSGTKNSQYGKMWVYNAILQKNVKISDAQLLDYKKQGWKVGRKFNWESTNCICCGKVFEKIGHEKLCSDKCKKLHTKKLRNPTNIINKIHNISSNYNIVFGSISNNMDFVVECMKNKCSKNQICFFLKVNNSGANYRLISKIYSRSSTD